MVESDAKTSTGMTQNLAGLLCYVAGFITGIVFLILEKENKFVRFHAIQSIGFSVALAILNVVFTVVPVIGVAFKWLLSGVGVALCIVLMYKAYHGERYKLPVIGNIAEQQVKPPSAG